ncbi:MAG: hypothetical protein ACKOC5_16590, partial [Chloroflexota bacterium]
KYGQIGDEDSREIIDSLCSDGCVTQSETMLLTDHLDLSSNLDPVHVASAFRQIEGILAEVKRQSREGRA